MIVATAPAPVRHQYLTVLAGVMALITASMTVAQLVTFEDFIQIIRDYQLTDLRGATVLAIGIVAAQIFSLPFLLRLWLSSLMRLLSAGFVLATPLVWLGLLVSAQAQNLTLPSTGLFGSVLDVPSCWLACGAVVVWLAAAWTCFVGLGGTKAFRLR